MPEPKPEDARTVFSAEGLAVTYIMVALEQYLPGFCDLAVGGAESDPLNTEVRRLGTAPPDHVLSELAHRALGLLREGRFVALAQVNAAKPPARKAKAGRK